MPAYSVTTTIHADPSAVFARVSDIASHATWSADPVQIEPVSEGRFRSSVSAKGKTITADISVVEREELERFVFDVDDATGRWRHTFTLEQGAGGTTVTRTISGRLSGAQLLLYWLVLLPIKKPSAQKTMRKLKETLEAPR